MEKEKYFVPNIEDIRVGYECEEFLSNKEWRHTVYKHSEDLLDLELVIKKEQIKVPYLTKEQIEAEGWEYKQTNKIRYWYEKESPEIGGNWYGYYIYKAKLIHDPEMKYLKILFSFDAVEDECVFEGECKDINTLKQIQKLLRI